jgi:hypothetical protein
MPKTSSTIVVYITEKSLAKIIRENRPPVGGTDRFVWDENQRGFGLRVYAPRAAGQGTRAAFICRHALGRTTLGDALLDGGITVAEAREEAGRYTTAAKKGRDLGAEERQASLDPTMRSSASFVAGTGSRFTAEPPIPSPRTT